MLVPGRMSRDIKCAAKFRIFEPHDLVAHPHIVVVCTSPHSHQAPERSMTPPLLREALDALLLDMRWRLADATPRRIVRDSGFMANLRHLLHWGDTPHDPVLSDLHPSLGNLDHLAYLIDALRKPIYPRGTDFEGMRACRPDTQLMLSRCSRPVPNAARPSEGAALHPLCGGAVAARVQQTRQDDHLHVS